MSSSCAHLGPVALTYYQARAGAAPRKTLRQQWTEDLKLRHCVHPLPDEVGQRVWRERAREDGRMREKKFGLAFSQEHSECTGTALRVLGPRSLLVHVHGVSSAGASSIPRSSHDKNTQLKARQKKCKHCARGIGYKAPSISDIPEVLRALTANPLWALRPIEIDVGEYRRGEHGYRIHTDMTRLRWRPQSVQDQVASLRGEDRRLAREAWRFLRSRPLPTPLRTWKEHMQFFRLHPSYSAYVSFVAQHNLFLAEAGPQPSKSARRLPVRFLETLGLETLWPHLYPAVALCETFVRLEDGRRAARERSDMRAAHAQRQQAQRRQASQAEPQISDTEDEESGSDVQGERAEEEEDDVESPLHFLKDSARQSLKASFLAKVMSSVIGYASDYELAQFVYDLWLWSSLGGAKHASGVQMRVALAGKPFSPEYW